MSTVIKVENVSKQYRLGQTGTGTFGHDLNRWWHNVRGKEDPYLMIGETNDRSKKGTSDYVWALRDINFEVKQGEAVGIIGRNGAGKSTLLKILSKTTAPTTGSIKIQGRVASLLEVGTGFHPELTGRENIFLNGAILGMRKKEIQRKLDQIIDFSGVERYVDTPVKRYSSGMYVRLAFAVAAHLESEILIVDEVLAVGDSEFQKKCLGKMNEVSIGEGRTVLFVSHNLGTISQLCIRSMLLKNGALVDIGETENILNQYIESGNNSQRKIENIDKEEENYFQTIYMCDRDLLSKDEYKFNDEICIKIRLKVTKDVSSLELAMRLIDKHKKAVFTIHHSLSELADNTGFIELLVSVPPNFLTPNLYSWVMCINHPGFRFYDLQDDIIPFRILDTGSDFARYEGIEYGNVFARYSVDKL